MKRKVLSFVLAAAMCLSLAACGGSSQADTATSAGSKEAAATASSTKEASATASSTSSSSAKSTADAVGLKEGEEYNIAIVKQLDHASLDEIANAVAAELDAEAKEYNCTINYEIYSGQNDQSVLLQIGDQCVQEEVDAIIPIATLAAQVMTTCAEDTQTPVIYAAISDPEAAELTDIDYVSGTSDMLNTESIMKMMLAVNPDLKKVGLLYSKSEANSAKPIEEAKAWLDENGIEYVEATGNTNDEVISAVSVLVSEEVDAVFTPTDNVVMAAELSIADTFKEAGIPHYTGADSFVRNGGFATCGVNYTDLGTLTAQLAVKAIAAGMADFDDYYLCDGGIITVNTETAEALNIDYSVFSDMGEVVEVQTTEE